ncbi:MAG: hypothetical protein EP329_11360 [Deltaproteobacteria bacterium]|nr:MAG: hypothetical protein EP329_11360 [Deltaproteobacteria bacterium]
MRCRTFPTELGPAGIAVDTPEAICPPDAWAPERTDLPTTRLLHLRAIVERSVHRAFLTRWNAWATARDGVERATMEARFWERIVADHRALAPILGPVLADRAGLEGLGAAWARAERDEAPLADPTHGPPLDALRSEPGLVALLERLRAALAKM